VDHDTCFSYLMPLLIPLHCCYSNLCVMHQVDAQWGVLSISLHLLCLDCSYGGEGDLHCNLLGEIDFGLC
jgi:hypothetical protein